MCEINSCLFSLDCFALCGQQTAIDSDGRNNFIVGSWTAGQHMNACMCECVSLNE